jgi:hypothetical protein
MNTGLIQYKSASFGFFSNKGPIFFYKESEDWQPHPRLDSLKAKAKAGGLWNLFIPLETDPDSR